MTVNVDLYSTMTSHSRAVLNHGCVSLGFRCFDALEYFFGLKFLPLLMLMAVWTTTDDTVRRQCAEQYWPIRRASNKSPLPLPEPRDAVPQSHLITHSKAVDDQCDEQSRDIVGANQN